MPKWRIDVSLKASSKSKADEAVSKFLNDTEGKRATHKEARNPRAVKAIDEATREEHDAVTGTVFLPDKAEADNVMRKWKGMLNRPDLYGKITKHLCSHGDKDVVPCNSKEAQLEVFEK